MLKFLLKQPEIDISIENNSGDTALDLVLNKNKTYFEIAQTLTSLGANIDEVKENQTRLLRAWINEDQEKAKQLIKLGANVEFSENFFRRNQTRYTKDAFFDDSDGYVRSSPSTAQKILVQLTLSKAFSKDFLEKEQVKESVKWYGIAVSYLCFKAQIEKLYLASFLIDTTPQRTFDLGFTMMQNRLKSRRQNVPSRLQPIPSTLLFSAHRERELANEISWQQWKNDYYYSKYPERKNQAGYGPGAMVVAKSGG